MYGGGCREVHAGGRSREAEEVVERGQAAYLMDLSSARTAPSRVEYSGLHGKWRQPYLLAVGEGQEGAAAGVEKARAT